MIKPPFVFMIIIKKLCVLILLGHVFFPVYSLSAKELNDHQRLKEAPYEKARKTGIISNPLIKEASGIVASSKNSNVLWIINDSANLPCLFAVSVNGQTIAQFNVKNAKNRDWEDLAFFQIENDSYILIADVGDNYAERKFCSLYVVKEPDIGTIRLKKDNPIELAWQIDFQYEDGPRDCESVAVDSQKNQILLLSKRTNPPVLYELPLEKSTRQSLGEARQIARLTQIPSPTKEDLKDKYGKYRSQPTAMDLSYDGKELILLTYKNAYSYKRNEFQQWKDVFEEKPLRIILPHPNTGELIKREAICIHHQSGELFVTSERIPAPIYKIKPKEFKDRAK